MKNILFYIQNFKPGGAERVLIDIINNLDRSRFNISVCCDLAEGVLLRQLPSDVKLYSLFSHKYSISRILCLLFSFRFGFDFFLKKKINSILTDNYDVEIAFMEERDTKFLYLHNSKSRKIGWVHTNFLINHWSRKIYLSLEQEQNVYAHFDSLCFVSKESQTSFFDVFPNLKISNKVIYNPINVPLIKEKSKIKCLEISNFTRADHSCNIVSVGRLHPIKGYDKLILAAKILKDKGLMFNINIIGNGPEFIKLKALIDANNLSEQVSLLGFSSNPYFILCQSDLFVSTSLTEGFPIAICEAMVLGLPIVSTRTSGTIEILDNSNYGVIVDHTPEDIAYELAKFIEDESYMLKYKSKSIERSAAYFNFDKSINIIEDYLYEL